MGNVILVCGDLLIIAFHNVIFKSMHLELNTLECFYDGGDCCLDGTESTCIKGIEFCIESEIGDGNCQDYNRGKNLKKINNVCQFFVNLGPKCNYDGKDCCPIPVEDGKNSSHGKKTKYHCLAHAT